MENNNLQLPQQLIQNGLNLLDGNLNATLFSNIQDVLQSQGINTNQLWKPAIDMIDRTTDILLYVYLPGVIRDSINIDFFNDIVYIKGERQFLNITNILNRSQEIIYGPFERRIKLPVSITRRESVAITLENGVMLIVIDKNIENSNRFTLTIDDFE
jgi:HSP20 family molecular chaperone IbpA